MIRFQYTATPDADAHRWLLAQLLPPSPTLFIPSAQAAPGQPIPEDKEPEEPKRK